jgi:hypothetical protein
MSQSDYPRRFVEDDIKMTTSPNSLILFIKPDLNEKHKFFCIHGCFCGSQDQIKLLKCHMNPIHSHSSNVHINVPS